MWILKCFCTNVDIRKGVMWLYEDITTYYMKKKVSSSWAMTLCSFTMVAYLWCVNKELQRSVWTLYHKSSYLWEQFLWVEFSETYILLDTIDHFIISVCSCNKFFEIIVQLQNIFLPFSPSKLSIYPAPLCFKFMTSFLNKFLFHAYVYVHMYICIHSQM